MARKGFSDDAVLKLLRQIEVELSSGADVKMACRSAGVSTGTCLDQRTTTGKFLKMKTAFGWL